MDIRKVFDQVIHSMEQSERFKESIDNDKIIGAMCFVFSVDGIVTVGAHEEGISAIFLDIVTEIIECCIIDHRSAIHECLKHAGRLREHQICLNDSNAEIKAKVGKMVMNMFNKDEDEKTH